MFHDEEFIVRNDFNDQRFITHVCPILLHHHDVSVTNWCLKDRLIVCAKCVLYHHHFMDDVWHKWFGMSYGCYATGILHSLGHTLVASYEPRPKQLHDKAIDN